MPDAALIQALFVLAVGLCFGSFITMASYRLPLGQDIVFKPSHCPHCNATLGLRDLWPVLSWLTARGVCRHCKAAVSARYPLTELATAALFLLLYTTYGLTLQSVLLALLAVALLVMIIADIEQYIIPDEVHLFLAPLGLYYHYVLQTPWEEVAAGFALGMATGLTLHYGYRWLRKKEGLGYGDVKFLAVAGLWLGLKPLVPFLFFSGLFGIVFGLLWRLLGKGPIFPFGPALAASLFLCIAFPQIPALFWTIGQWI